MTDFLPDWYSPTGHTIRTCLEEKGISAAQFAAKLGRPADFVLGLLDGTEPVTEDLAGQLASIIGSTKQFWLRREATYRADKARIDGAKTWTQEPPKISAYYWVIPKNRDDWLDSSPEAAYLYFDGKYSVARPGKWQHSPVEDIEWWCGPLDMPSLPPGVDYE